MGKNDHIYWQHWQKLLETAANFQQLITGTVMIEGIQPPFNSWDHIINTCEEISVELGDRL